MKRTAVFLLVLAFVLGGTAFSVSANEELLVTYTGDTLPSADGWFVYPRSYTTESAVSSIENGILHLNCPIVKVLYFFELI